MLPSDEQSDRFLTLSDFSYLGQNSRKIMFCYVPRWASEIALSVIPSVQSGWIRT